MQTLNTGSGSAALGRQAVIDIGSNSIRLVIYEGPLRSPFAIFNEKALCGLGRDVGPNGALNPAAVASAFATLRRFRLLLDENGRPTTRVIATAAVREAADGPEFVEAVRDIGFEVEVIGGDREACLAALGVVSLEPSATGLVGDMGGGSLELVSLVEGAIGDMTSLSIGPLRLMQQAGTDQSAAKRLIDASLGKVEWLVKSRFPRLFAVGGAWRTLARIHMRVKSHPLPVLHHYEISAKQAIEICDLVARQSRASLEEIPGVASRRIDTLPLAALVMKAVIERAGLQEVVVCAGGVREGLLFEALSDTQRQIDPLFESARFLASRLSPTPESGEVAANFIAPLFVDESPMLRRRRIAAALLIDIGSFFHPDLRGAQAFDTALRGPFTGLSHADRVAIALSLYCRHEGRRTAYPDPAPLALLAPEDKLHAIRVGLALRAAAAYSPKMPGPLMAARLKLEGGALVLEAPLRLRPLMEDMARRRLDSLANAFGVIAAERYVD